MKRNNTSKRILLRGVLSMILSLLMILGLVPGGGQVLTAHADPAPGKTITGLGTGAISNPVVPESKDSAWSGSFVYYGTYGEQPVKYRVLAPSTNIFGGNTMFLDCDTTLFDHEFRNDYGAENPNQWSASDVRTKLNSPEDENSFLNKGFNAVERAAIAESTIAEHELENFVTGDAKEWFGREEDGKKYYTPLDKDKIFLLDVEDILNTAYGYCSDYGNDVEHHNVNSHKKSGSSSWWWLRSPFSDDSYYAGYVDSAGDVRVRRVNSSIGVSPAFNINLSSVIFSSLISGTAGVAGAEYKLTLKDSNLTIAAGAKRDTDDTSKYHISYDITDNSTVAAPSQVSVVVTDGTWSTDSGWIGATKFQYTKLDVDFFAATGTGTFTLDNNITGTWGTNYRVYVLAEDVNTGNATDYASAPLELKLPSYGLKFDANDGTGLMASENVSDNDTFTFPACGFTAPVGKPFDHWEMSGVDGWFYPDKSDQNEVIIASNCADSYGIITVTAKWKDLPAATVTTAPTAKDLTYNGSPQELVNAGVASGGEMQYVIGTDATTVPTDGWSANIPTATVAGTYYVWYKAKGDAAHSDSTPGCVTVTIKNKPSPPSPTPSYTYYTVKFEMNSHGKQVSSQTVRSGSKAKRPEAPTEEGYTFGGWFEDAGLTSEYDFSSAVRKNMTLYAKWEEIRFTVSFDLDGKGSIDPQSVKQGEVAQRPDDPSAEGYTFAGWYSDAGLTSEYDFSSAVRKNMTLYAKWEEIRFTVSFDLDGKGSIDPQSVKQGETAKRPSDPTAEEYYFVGWYADDNPYDFSTPVTKDITLHAKWIKLVSVHRLYNPNSGAHLFTSNVSEKDILVSVGWSYEGVAWYAPESSNIPVYRVYNPNSGEHHYTMSAGEKDILVGLGWNDEGICWYSDESQGTPLYRLYNPNATGQYAAGAHHYTKDIEERDYIIAAGWNDEGIGWYGK